MATRKDDNKRQWHLLPIEAIEEIIKVLEFGVKKYSENNWRTAPYLTRHQITNSMKRHQAAIDKGELYDSESRLLHSAHVTVNALFQLHYDLKGYFNQPVGITGIVDTGTVVPQVTVITPSTDSVTLIDLIGTHTLTGWERNLLGDESAEDFSLELNGVTYTFVEDEDDGYRSSLDRILVDKVVITNTFEPLTVQAFLDGEMLVLVHKGKEIVRVGTRDHEDWYPCFVAEVKNLPTTA